MASAVPRPASSLTSGRPRLVSSLTRYAIKPDSKRSCISKATKAESKAELPQEDQDKLVKLKQENERLRKLVHEHAAARLTPERLQHFAQQYNSLAVRATSVGVSVDSDLLSSVSAAVPPAPPPTAAPPPPPTESASVPPSADSATAATAASAVAPASAEPATAPEAPPPVIIGDASHHVGGTAPTPVPPTAPLTVSDHVVTQAATAAPVTPAHVGDAHPAPATATAAAAAATAIVPPGVVDLPSHPSHHEIHYANSSGLPMRARVDNSKTDVLTFCFDALDPAGQSESDAVVAASRLVGRGAGPRVLATRIVIDGLENEVVEAEVEEAEVEEAGAEAEGPVPPVSSEQREGKEEQGEEGDGVSRVLGSSAPPGPPHQPATSASTTTDPRSSARATARELVSSHDPADAVFDKHHWLLVTVPETPVGGTDLVLYFNKNQSEGLRNSQRVQLTYGFNSWELAVPEAERCVDLTPEEGITHEFGADFWKCKIKIPEDAYELNFVFGDCAGAFENNLGRDFTLPVTHGITWDEWVDSAADRAAAAQALRHAEEMERERAAEEERAEAGRKQDLERGWARANDLRYRYSGLQQGSTLEFDRNGRPLWRVTGSSVPGGSVVLRYNLRAADDNMSWLADKEDAEVEVKYGFSGWRNAGVAKMKRVAEAGGVVPGADQWWEVAVDLPVDAASLEFVVRAGPEDVWDNNGGLDYRARVDLPADLEGQEGQSALDEWIARVAEVYRQQEQEGRTAREAEARAKEAVRSEKRRKAQEMVKQVERRKVRHVLFTEPEVIQAGQPVTVFYNPNAGTNLAGRTSIHMYGSWNRWTHPRSWGPVEMTAPAVGDHFQATIKVPGDAFKMDFVFSDSHTAGHGTYDNRGGFDYHLPVEGSPVKEPSLYVAHIAVEMAPIAKVGGLGDVVTALGRAVKEQGHLVEVILPRYDFFSHSPVLSGQMRLEAEFDWGGCRVYVTTAIVEGLRCFFIEPSNGFFNTGTVYGRSDDEVRFDFFCLAALEFLLRTGRQPDILHCHDWSTARVAKAYWENYQPYGLWKPKVVFTIHNLDFGAKKIAEAAHHCQKFTTVSPTYAYEIGGTPLIRPHLHKFAGIRNGIDIELWDPETTQFLPHNYTSDNAAEGKAQARQALRQRLGLTGWGDKFIVGVISRLTHQKGTALIKHAQWRTLERGGQFVLLGSAPDPRVQAEYNALAASTSGENCSFNFKYDEPLSYLIYAAADMIVVPSNFEPCGLTQLIAMRYGAVPVVRHTGGLRDTVFDVDFDKARAAWDLLGSSNWERDKLDATNGFAFGGTDAGALDSALNRAIDAWYNDRDWFRSLQKRVMDQDWSWNRPAIDYVELYYSAIKS